jgi:hypothetical protein
LPPIYLIPRAPPADLTKSISKDYEVLIEEGENAGVALRGLFIISPEGILRQKTVNDLPVGRSGELWLSRDCPHCAVWGVQCSTYQVPPVTSPLGNLLPFPHTPGPTWLPTAPAVDETLRLLKAFQFTDKHGEVRGGCQLAVHRTPARLRLCLPACLPDTRHCSLPWMPLPLSN